MRDLAALRERRGERDGHAAVVRRDGRARATPATSYAFDPTCSARGGSWPGEQFFTLGPPVTTDFVRAIVLHE